MQGYLENRFNFTAPSELNMYYCGRRIKTLNHSYGPEIREHYLLMYCVHGKATFHGNSGDIRFGSRDLLVMLPNQKIFYEADKGSEWTSWWTGVYGPLVGQFLEMLGVTADNPIIHIKNSFKMELLLQSIYEASFDDTPAGKTKCISLIFEMFSFLFENSNTSSREDLVDDVINIIKHNYEQRIGVGDIAEMLHINPCYLSRIFKEKVGVSPKEYLLTYKVNRAKELFERTDLGVAEVSRSVGFEDPLYFSRIFKKKAGVTPSEYKSQSV